MRLKSIALILALIFIFSAIYLARNFSRPKEDLTAKVFKAVDGDTVELTNGQRVRLIGINTPERRQYYYEEASSRLRQLVEGKEVFLEKDVSNRDSYGRLLRYVYVGSLFVNLEMVKEGYARADDVAPNLKYSDVFLKAEAEAKAEGIGVWKYG